jgi:MHS family proline/betaine transporter-like MFS transporter
MSDDASVGLGAARDVGAARRAVLATSIGSFVETFDLALYGYFAVILAGQFFPADDPAAALLATFGIFALGFAARPFGGMFFGHIGDRLGRRTAVVASILLMAAATLAISVLPTYGQVGTLASVLLLVCRLLQGFSIGGEVAGGNVFVLEHATPRWSGRAVAANLAAGTLGLAAASALSLLLATVLDEAALASWGWRLPFALAAPLGLVGVYLRLRVSDSPAFRRLLEDRAATAARRRFPLGHALRTAWRGMLVFGGFAAMVLLGSYLLIGYLPSYLTKVAGLSTSQAFAANVAAAVSLGAGALVGGYLVDRTSPRFAATVCAAGVIATVVPGFLVIQRGTLGAAVLGAACWAVFLGIGNVAGASLALHLFPVPIRYTATAFALNVTGAVFAGTGPYLSAWLVGRSGNTTAPAFYLTAVALVSLTVAVSAIRTQGSAAREAGAGGAGGREPEVSPGVAPT